MNEGQLKFKLINSLRRMKSWVYSPRDMIHSGIPDIIACIDGKFVAIEVKYYKKGHGKPRLTKLQMKTLLNVAKSGGLAIVWRFSDIDAVVRAKIYYSKRYQNFYEVIVHPNPLDKEDYAWIIRNLML